MGILYIFRESHKEEGYKTRIKSHKKKPATSFYQLFYQRRISKGKKPHSVSQHTSARAKPFGVGQSSECGVKISKF
jgi:hypothetical protein